ncbi:preprotein translocase subunit YajC [mine drainage metagenome]|uniref:Preprotein translocase subunit YajC n=1 Tax=mine drainage metagenome TaxID=410659 RepID=A0A1J5R204_9ZZZZ
MFISQALAQTAGSSASPAAGVEQFLPFALILVVFYFLMWRPQAKKAKQHREMVSALRRGDKVLLQSGIYGTVTKVVDDAVVLVEIADEVKVRVARASISEVLSKTEPVAGASKDAKDKPAAKEPGSEAAAEDDK